MSYQDFVSLALVMAGVVAFCAAMAYYHFLLAKRDDHIADLQTDFDNVTHALAEMTADRDIWKDRSRRGGYRGKRIEPL